MKTKDLALVPDTKGIKRGQKASDQILASELRDGVNNANSKKVYLRPSDSDAKIDEFFKFFNQERNRQFEIETLFVAIRAKYENQFGRDFVNNLIDDADLFTNHFSSDICTKLEDGISGTDISYLKGENKIARYLVNVDDANICSIFRHFIDYAVSSERDSVKAIIDYNKKVSEERRIKNLNERRIEKKENEKKITIQSMSARDLVSKFTPGQLEALKALLIK